MRFLRTLARAVADGFGRQIFRWKIFLNQTAASAHRIIAEVGRIGPHVGDVARLIETLRERHGLLNAESHARARRLLQG